MKFFSGSIYTLNLKWSTFLMRKRQEHVYFMQKAISFCIAKTVHWNRMGSFLSNFFLVVLNIWSSPFTGRGCPEQCPWRGLRERERWLIPCTLLYWCSFLPESSDPEWCWPIPIRDARSPQDQTEHYSNLMTLSFPKPLCCLRTHLYITSQQFLGEEILLFIQLFKDFYMSLRICLASAQCLLQYRTQKDLQKLTEDNTRQKRLRMMGYSRMVWGRRASCPPGQHVQGQVNENLPLAFIFLVTEDVRLCAGD